MKGHIPVIKNLLKKGENVDAVTKVIRDIFQIKLSVYSLSSICYLNIVTSIFGIGKLHRSSLGS